LDILAIEGEKDWLYQKIGIELSFYSAYNPGREQVSEHVQFQCGFPLEEHQMVEYTRVL